MTSEASRPDQPASGQPAGGPEALALDLVWRAVCSPDGHTAHCRKCGRRGPFHRVSTRRAFACDRCGSHLYPATATPFAGSPLPLSAWLHATAIVTGSLRPVSARQLATILDLPYRTAWRMGRRIQESLAADGESRQLLQALAGAWAQKAAPIAEFPADLGTPEDRIRAAACRVMAERGAASARIADIAAAAGVSAGSIHYYFRSKDQALLDAFRWAGERLHENLRQLGEEEISPLEHIRRLLELSLPSDRGLHDEYLLWLEVWVRVRDHPNFLQESTKMSRRWFEAVRQIFGRGISAGLLTPVTELDEICERYVAIAESLAYRAALGYTDTGPDRARRVLARFTAEQLGLAPEQLGCA